MVPIRLIKEGKELAVAQKEKRTLTPKEHLTRYLTEMEGVVKQMTSLYNQYPELNIEANIEDVILMSLDEWECELRAKIDELEDEGDEEKEVDEGLELFSPLITFGIGMFNVEGEEVKCGYPQDEF